MTRQELVEGLPAGPDGVRIRYAVPEVAGVVTELLKTAADEMEPVISKHSSTGSAGRGCWLGSRASV